jgi:hypothetical protein
MPELQEGRYAGEFVVSEVQNVRAFGSESMLEGVQAVVNQRMRGAPAIKSATLTVTVDYETSAPLS